MKAVVLLQTNGLSEVQQAVRDHFQRGGSWVTALLILTVLAMLVYLVHRLTQLQRVARAGAPLFDPQRLFRDLLGKLDLTSEQRELLSTVANALRLPQPAVILLSPARFDRSFEQWWARRRNGTRELKSARRTALERFSLLRAGSGALEGNRYPKKPRGLKPFPVSYAASTALRDTSNGEKPRGLKPAARNTETGNALSSAAVNPAGGLPSPPDLIAQTRAVLFPGA